MTIDRRRLGRLGEELAARFLQRRGLSIIARNRRVGRGEIDIVARHGRRIVAVEVKTAAGPDPIYAFDDAKARQVRALASRIGASRVDVVAVSLEREGASIRWLAGV